MPGAKKGSDGLTDKQREYTRHRAEGKSQIEAYALAGYSTNQSEDSRRQNASHLESLEAVRRNIERLQALADAGAVMSTEQRKCALYEIYLDSTNSTRDRLRALDLLNRMSGDYIDRAELHATVQGLTREDRAEAMTETLKSLKTAWEASRVE